MESVLVLKKNKWVLQPQTYLAINFIFIFRICVFVTQVSGDMIQTPEVEVTDSIIKVQVLKFSLVQTFAELLVSPSEEIFMVLIFASPSARRTIVWCTYAAYSKFRGSYFRGGRPIHEKREILHQAKISRLYGMQKSAYGT